MLKSAGQAASWCSVSVYKHRGSCPRPILRALLNATGVADIVQCCASLRVPILRKNLVDNFIGANSC